MIIDIEQGSEAWKQLRRTKVTATDSAVILGYSPYKDADKLLYEKNNGIEEMVNEYMQRGKDLEPIARKFYEDSVGYKMSPTVHIGDISYDWSMCSTDGLSEDGKILLEIKCGKKALQQAKKNFIPDYYICQIQQCLWITNASECHYLAFNNPDDHVLMKIGKNEKFIENMIEPCFKFYKKLKTGS